MSVHILEGREGKAAFYCSTTDWAFGPIMDSLEEAEAFLKWLPGDPRTYKDNTLEGKYSEFRRQYVCECGSVADGEPDLREREVMGDECAIEECPYAHDGDSKFCLDHQPTIGFPRTDGERFVCNYCAKKAA